MRAHTAGIGSSGILFACLARASIDPRDSDGDEKDARLSAGEQDAERGPNCPRHARARHVQLLPLVGLRD